MLPPSDILTIFKQLCAKHLEEHGYFVVIFPYTRPDMTEEERKTGSYNCISSINDVSVAEVLERCARALRMAAQGEVDDKIFGERIRLESDPEPDVN